MSNCRVCHKPFKNEHGRGVHEKRMHKDFIPPPKRVVDMAVPWPVDLKASQDALDEEKPLEGLVNDPCGFIRSEAESRSEDMGHDLELWRQAGKNSARAFCRTCGLLAYYAQTPMKGNEKVGGDALSIKCK